MEQPSINNLTNRSEASNVSLIKEKKTTTRHRKDLMLPESELSDTANNPEIFDDISSHHIELSPKKSMIERKKTLRGDNAHTAINENNNFFAELQNKHKNIKDHTSFEKEVMNLKSGIKQNFQIKIHHSGPLCRSIKLIKDEIEKTNFTENPDKLFENKKYPTLNIKTHLFYFEKIINIVLKKYKPELIKDKYSNYQNQHKITNLGISSNDQFKRFKNEMEAFDKKLTEIISKAMIYNENITVLDEDSGYNPSLLYQLNKENIKIKQMLFIIYKYPFENYYYLTWKTNLLILAAMWKYEKVTRPNQIVKIQYLKTRLILEKILICKEKKTIGQNFLLENILKRTQAATLNHEKTNNLKLFNFFKLNNENYPIFSYVDDCRTMICLDFIVDFHIVYVMIMCPLYAFMHVHILTFTVISFLLDVTYFLSIICRFRRLPYSESKRTNTNLKDIFFSTLKFNLLLDFVTYIPFTTIFSNMYESDQSYLISYTLLLPMMRIVNFGKSINYMEKTKYAMFCRLAVLILRFVVLAHVIGVFIVFVSVEFPSSSNYKNMVDAYKLEAACIEVQEGEKILTPDCRYSISLMMGTYLIPGAFLSGCKLLDSISQNIFEYYLLFFTYFIGQVIVAYVFGNVNELIRNLNQAANIYREKTDDVKSFMQIYGYNNSTQEDITFFYLYLYQKKRNHIYEKDLLKSLSKSIKMKIAEHIVPHHRYFLQDFYGLSKDKEKEMITSILTHIKEYIAFPFERIYKQGNVIKGLFILVDGSAIFCDEGESEREDDHNCSSFQGLTVKIPHNSKKRTDMHIRTKINRKSCMEFIKLNQIHNNPSANDKIGNLDHNIKKEDDSELRLTSFPLESIFMKTGRAIETCYVEDFTDFYLLDLNYFDNVLIVNFPLEMQKLKQKAIEIGVRKIGDNLRIKEMVFQYSSRSIDDYYEESFDLNNIWIDIKYRVPTIHYEDTFDCDNKQILTSENIHENTIGLFEMTLGK